MLENFPPEAQRTTTRSATFATYLGLIALILSCLNYPFMVFGKGPIVRSLWYLGLGLAGLSLVVLLVSLFRSSWLAISHRGDVNTPVSVLWRCLALVSLWCCYFVRLGHLP